jgi:catechol 2,3-dioxygenase-like lactoylglutathione lyase family enzyme
MNATPERIQDIAHLGSVELLTPKLDRSLWYFKDVLGMEVVHVDGQSVYLRGYGDHAASALKLTAAARSARRRSSGASRRSRRPARGSAGSTATSAAARATASATPTGISWRCITRSRSTSRPTTCARP